MYHVYTSVHVYVVFFLSLQDLKMVKHCIEVGAQSRTVMTLVNFSFLWTIIKRAMQVRQIV